MTYPPYFQWSEAAIAELHRLAAQAISAGQIGRILGISRNAVLGKMWRLGLRSLHIQRSNGPRPRTPRAPRKPRSRAPAYRARFTAKPALEPSPWTGKPLLLVDLEPDQCRWPVSGEGINALFCGAVQCDGSSYCLCHYARSISGRPAFTRAELELHQRKMAKNYTAAA